MEAGTAEFVVLFNQCDLQAKLVGLDCCQVAPGPAADDSHVVKDGLCAQCSPFPGQLVHSYDLECRNATGSNRRRILSPPEEVSQATQGCENSLRVNSCNSWPKKIATNYTKEIATTTLPAL